MDKDLLNKQSQHWENNFSNKPEMFGVSPSDPANYTLEIFKKNHVKNIIEFGAGQGRDSFLFANNDIHVHALDYSQSAINKINENNKLENPYKDRASIIYAVATSGKATNNQNIGIVLVTYGSQTNSKTINVAICYKENCSDSSNRTETNLIIE